MGFILGGTASAPSTHEKPLNNLRRSATEAQLGLGFEVELLECTGVALESALRHRLEPSPEGPWDLAQESTMRQLGPAAQGTWAT